MAEGYFNPWRDVSERACATCRYSIGRPDGFHLWCEKHRLVVVFPCGWWEREAGTEPEAGPGFGPAGTLLADRAADSGGTYPEMQQRRGG